jgi:hypothetical protein
MNYKYIKHYKIKTLMNQHTTAKNSLRDGSLDWLREEGLEPLYLDATECRAAGVVTADSIPLVDQVSDKLKLSIAWGVIVEQCAIHYKYYVPVEVGYLNAGSDSIYYVTLIKKDILYSVIYPALKEGRRVVIGDVDKKKYTVPKTIHTHGFTRTQAEYWNVDHPNHLCFSTISRWTDEDLCFDKVMGTIQIAWGNGKLFI